MIKIIKEEFISDIDKFEKELTKDVKEFINKLNDKYDEDIRMSQEGYAFVEHIIKNKKERDEYYNKLAKK